MSVVLYHLEISHYNEKVRFALSYKGIAHERRTPTPGAHGLAAMWLTRSRHDRLPVLEIDGRRIGDSTAIIAALEEYQPDPPLYPSDIHDRARALELEDFFDEQLAPYVRAFAFSSLFASGVPVGPVIAPSAAGGVQRVLTATAPVAKRIMGIQYGTPLGRQEEDKAKIRAAMDRLEAELRPSGYLAGDAFSVADLTAAALFTPILHPPRREFTPPAPAAVRELRAELEARPGGAWVHEIYAKHR